MKRVFALIIVLVISGCGNSSSEINCSKVQEEEYVVMNQNMKIVYSGKKIKNAEFTIDAELKDNYTSSKEYFVNLLQNQFTSLESLYDINLEVQQTSKGAKLIMNMDEESFGSVYNSDNIDKDSIIKKFESNGYTCK